MFHTGNFPPSSDSESVILFLLILGWIVHEQCLSFFFFLFWVGLFMKKKKKDKHTQQQNTPKPYITVPYYRGLSESVKKKCSNYGVQVYFRGGTTIKNLLMAPKDKDPMMKKSGVIYSYKCGRVDCDEEYIGESSRTFGERFKEHQKAPSPIFDHHTITGHDISVENFNIVGERNITSKGQYIRVNNPSLNRNVGKYHLPHIWDENLENISELKLK